MRKKTRLTALLLLLLQCGSGLADDFEVRADNVFDQGFYPGVLCDQCRDSTDHPMDFAAAAYNMFFGDEPWARDSLISWPFRIYNTQGQYAVIWFEDLLFDVPTLLPDLLTVVVRLQNGMVLRFEVLQDGSDLPVGDPAPSSSSDCTCSGGDGEGSEDDPEDIDDEFDPPEYEGTVGIEDPDEDGEFPEWEEEL